MGRINKINPNDVANGSGVVVSVWFQGCPHHCFGCFNKETWNFKKGEEFSKYHIKKIIEYIKYDGIYRNLSILGGECLCEENIESTLLLCKSVKKEYSNIKIYLWSGYTYEQIMSFEMGREVLQHINFLIDGKFELDKKDLSLRFRGSSNQRVIDVKESLKQNKVIEYI